ncbi:hypothetical protein H310_12859 [Aphanomyces invadans]|uniref:Uncharacterized protein n=1 Tax=Aphanomyces invadans TaxID=157072 RepID=A0A024TGC3_9STRA|nr:hypothetical protein H310_12859 [Aphanomyces invadans]ETV93049.1 hypothetical protein H310_12859 [Aphanomyces invadans]|eukprot:XP_008878315.1 hypothetical protein H310_12859 [Aphanomyces invadans]
MAWGKFLRSMVRRGPFDPRHYLVHPSRANGKHSYQCRPSNTSSTASHIWGPPLPNAAKVDTQLDTHLFALYFLVTETLATFLWLSIAAHCLRGTRVPFLSLPMRFVVGCLYCVVKLALLEYAFHASLYFHISFMVAIIYLVLSTLAWGWHRGPLWFLYYMNPPRLFQPFSIHGCIQHIVYLVFQCIASPTTTTARPPPTPRPSQHTASSPSRSGTPSSAVSTPLNVHMMGHFLHVPLRLDIWNSTLTEHWRQAILYYGDDCRHRRLSPDMSATEARLLVAMDANGLLLHFYLTPPDATTVHALSRMAADGGAAVTVLELVLRYHNHSSSTRSTTHMQFQKLPYVYYATNPISSARLTRMQRTAVVHLLQRLNVNPAIGCDHISPVRPHRRWKCSHAIPLRMLQCSNFLTLPLTKAASRPRRSSHHAMSSADLESILG